MGIPGLTSYLDSISKLWKRIELRDTRLVVDGSCLMYFLYFNFALDCRCGGQYDEFKAVVTSFFDALHAGGVEPFVVLDGAYDASNKKLETYKTRCKEAIRRAHSLAKGGEPEGDKSCLLPLLTRRTLVQVLSKLGIRFAVCDCEADRQTASLANSWGCPVLSNDSDFFIYHVHKGYIPVNSLNWESQPLTARVFRAGQLAGHFKIPQSFLPLAASLMGNDYLSQEMLAPFNHTLKRIQTSTKCSKKASRFLSIASFLSDFKTLNDAVSAVLQVFPKNKCTDMQQSLNCSLEEYDISLESNLVAYFNDGKVSSLLRSADDLVIAKWVLQKFRKGLFPVEYMSSLTTHKQFLRVQVENIGEVSANNCSLKLRQAIYAILFAEQVNNNRFKGSVHKEVTKSVHEAATDIQETRSQKSFDGVHEWDRDGKGLRQSVIKPYGELVEDFTSWPSLGNIPSLSTSQRQCFLLNILQFKSNHSLKELPGKFQLLIATLVLWAKTALPKVNKQHLEALLVSFLKLDATDGKPTRNQKAMCTDGSLFDLHAAHSYAQWQCILNEAINLNLLLIEPLSTPFVPGVYSGQMVHEVLHQLKRGISSTSLVDCPDMLDALYCAVKECIAPDTLLDSDPSQAVNYDRASKDKLEKKAQRKEKTGSKKQMQLCASVSTNNRFSFLCVESSGSDTDDDNF